MDAVRLGWRELQGKRLEKIEKGRKACLAVNVDESIGETSPLECATCWNSFRY